MAGELLIDAPLDGVRRLTISNPAKRNALDHAILDGIAEAVRAADADGVRALILTGANGMFSSGYDIGDIPPDVFAAEAEKLVAHPFTSAIDALDATNIPTIAALPGHDRRRAGAGAGLRPARRPRRHPAWDAAGQARPRLLPTGLRRFLHAIGEPRTRQLFLLGRNISAREAQSWGLVHELAGAEDLEAFALDWAAELAANAPLSVRGNKRVLRALLAAEASLHPEIEAELIALRKACFDSEDLAEGVRAFGEKRPARWQGR